MEKLWRQGLSQDKIRRASRRPVGTLSCRAAEIAWLLAEGLVPAAGTVRSGEQAPALGRRDVGPAARQRMRDLVAQTELFLSDPAGTLPHYPLWDMNRGFGP